MSKVVVFDVDGTLFDTKPGIIKALNEVLHNFGEKCINSNEEDKWIGPPVRNSFITFVGMNAELAEEATKQYRQIYTEKYIAESILYDGMLEVLSKLKETGYHLCIATMKTQCQIDRLLSLRNITEYFEIIQCAALDGSKSKSEMLEYIKTQYSSKNQFYMIGDTKGDYEAAKKADYDFIAVTYGYGDWNNLDLSIDMITIALEIVEKINMKYKQNKDYNEVYNERA